MIEVMVDADLILEAFLNRGPRIADVEEAYKMLQSHWIQGHLTELGLENINSILSKLVSSELAEEIVAGIEEAVETCPIDFTILEEARLLNIRDFESAVEVACATANNLGAILTSDPLAFEGANLRILQVSDLGKVEDLERILREDASPAVPVEDRQELQRRREEIRGICSNMSIFSRFQNLNNRFQSTSAGEQKRVRKALLKAVKREVTARLQDSLYRDNPYLELPMEDRGQDVGRPQQTQVLERLSAIAELFEREDIAGRLLILGEPGSGKTTTLLQLAQALSQQAEIDRTAPVPVIFELSSWDGQPIDRWLVAQIKENYSIRKPVSQQWLKNNQLLPLLDGLDELGIPRQRECIKAINQFLHQDSQRRLVVCCRALEYREGRAMLYKLNGAYGLLSPDDAQIRDYLQDIEKLDLWDAIQSNRPMKDLARNPLFLNVMVTAYQGEPITTETQLFNAYIDKCLQRPDPKKYPQNPPYQEQETRRWLTYLARQLEAESQTEFLIEKMQPYWVQGRLRRVAFRLIFGLILGLIAGLILGLSGWGMYERISRLIPALIVCPVFGAIGGLFSYNFTQRKFRTEAFSLKGNKLVNILRGGLVFGIAFWVVAWIVEFLVQGIVGTQSFGFFFGLCWGTIRESRAEIKARETPNQGIKQSFKNTLIISGLTFPIGMLMVPFISLATGMLFTGNQIVGMGLLFGLSLGLATGCLDWISHLTLRLILWQSGAIPWNYARFLRYAAERKLIQQVGGRYRFLHDALRKHLSYGARLNAQPSPPLGKVRTVLNYTLVILTVSVGYLFNSSIYPVGEVYLVENVHQVKAQPELGVVPSIESEDWIIHDYVTYRFRDYPRGGVVRFRIDPKLDNQYFSPNHTYVLRIFGLPGETVEMRQGRVYINNQPLQTEHLDALSIPRNDDPIAYEIPADSYFVMGKDNDSERFFEGLVTKEDILSRPVFRLWPPKRFGPVE